MKLRTLLLTQVVFFTTAGVATSSFAQPSSTQAGSSNWSGSYGGASGGYGSGHSNQSDSGIPTPPLVCDVETGDGSFGVGGGFIGGNLGYNWQSGALVFGLEGDYSWADISGSSATCGTVPHACGTTLESFGTFRGRLGYAIPGSNWLPYLTGGLAVGDVNAWDSLTPASGSKFMAGWTIGCGIEAVIAPRWTAKLEYLYADLGSATLFNIVPGVPETVSFKANLIRIGVDYHFGGPEPPPRPLVTKN